MTTKFKYKAVTPDGIRRTGTVAATELAGAEEYLNDQGLLPIEISPVKTREKVSLFGFLKGTDYESLIMFTSALATMQRAGIPLLRSLAIIRIGPKDGHFNAALDKLGAEVHSGTSLSEGMRKSPEIFSEVFVSSVAAGEESGHLDHTLDQVALMLEREMELTRQLKAGIRYPLMVVIAIVAAFFVLMNFVIPRFLNFYSAFDAELPLPTRIIMGISEMVTTYWPIMLLLAIVIGFGLRQFLSTEKGRYWFDSKILKVPVLGTLIIRGNVARFALMFRILFGAGLPIVKAVTILAGTIKNAAIAREITYMGTLFQKGSEIDPENQEFVFFPVQFLHMLSIGLESGNMDAMLREIGEHYTKQVMYTSRQLTSIIEPVLTLVMGAFILILALAIFLPMWNLIKVFQG